MVTPALKPEELILAISAKLSRFLYSNVYSTHANDIIFSGNMKKE